MSAPETRSVFEATQDQVLMVGLREVTGPQAKGIGLQTEPSAASRESPPCGEEVNGAGVRKVSPEGDRSGEVTAVRETRDGSPPEVSDRMFCSACQCPFDSREDQMEHYKLDWHRFNLRQKLNGRPPVTAEEFEKKTGTGDMSSISGSDSDSDSDSESDQGFHGDEVTPARSCSPVEREVSAGRVSSKAVFQNAQGQYLCVQRCILQGKRPTEGDDVDLLASLLSLSSKSVWVILMTGGGHFAGAVFRGKEILEHKTFHRYTVRAKRGTAQGLRDSQNRSHAPKSAGSTLRRYNEAALVKDIQDLLESWTSLLREANAIFLRAPSYNKSIFFGGRAPPLDKRDPRIHTLPFATRRATFREVQRVHDVLATLHIHGGDAELDSIFSPSKKVWKRKARAVAPVNTGEQVKPKEEEDGGEEEEEEACSGEEELQMVEVTLGTLDLREHEVYPATRKPRRRRKDKHPKHKAHTEQTQQREGSRLSPVQQVEDDEGEEEEEDASVAALEAPSEPSDEVRSSRSRGKRKNKKQKDKPQEDEADDGWDYALRDALYTACKTGDLQSLHTLLELPPPPAKEEEEEEDGGMRDNLSKVSTPLTFLNQPIDQSGFTLLHVASAAGQKGVLTLLMDLGCDPACKDKKGQTPYVVAPEKDTRNVFRKYMGDHPDKYDYAKAQVPGPLTAEIEAKKAEKKKALKSAKKQREKEQREVKRKEEMEKEEKKRFAALSDREKRALAAERRLAEQMASTDAPISNVKRCWLCGESLLGKVPFQYLDFSFCSPRCVQAHRKANNPTGKP